MKRAARGKSTTASKKQKTAADPEKEFDDFFENLSGNEVESLKFVGNGGKSELHVGLKSKKPCVLIFADSNVKLDRNDNSKPAFSYFPKRKPATSKDLPILSKTEAGKTEKQMISKYFQSIIEKSADFLKTIDISSKNFPFSSTNIKNCKNLEILKVYQNGSNVNLGDCGFLSEETLFKITGKISIHGVSLDGELLDFEKMKAKRVSCNQVTGSVGDVISNYLNKFEDNNIENVIEHVDLEMVGEESERDSDDEEDYAYQTYCDKFENKLHEDFENLVGGYETVRKPVLTEDECCFEIANETHQIEINCEGNNFNMSKVEREDF
ncbi:unnamed protein product [Caenorhabditis angaria]|uniref:Uncharacterized protein n=1 Tax=Caenorhabditis angaria TaxID=860376 RepID=A0A9P1IM43_9PELO|nr:unnamed protein product [Caenorhabditis angaria]